MKMRIFCQKLQLTNLLHINRFSAGIGSGEDLDAAGLLAGLQVVGYKVIAGQHVQRVLALLYAYYLLCC